MVKPENIVDEKNYVFRISPEYIVFLIFLSGLAFVNISIWYEGLPGKTMTLLISFAVLYIIAYFYIIELSIYKNKIVVRRPLIPFSSLVLTHSEIIYVKIVNTTFTKYRTRVDVKRKGKLLSRTIRLYSYDSEPRKLFNMLKANCEFPVELRLD